MVRKIRGRYHLMFQVCEMRKHALLEAHVRMYTVRKDMDHLGTGAVAYFQPFHMRVQHPDDELGGAWSLTPFCAFVGQSTCGAGLLCARKRLVVMPLVLLALLDCLSLS